MAEEDSDNDPSGPAALNAPEDNVRDVLQRALAHDGLARGLREVVKAIEREEAQMCFLAEDIDQKNYVLLITALCQQREIPLVKVSKRLSLGQWAGLCKADAEGNATKIVKCSSCVIRDWGEHSASREYCLRMANEE